MRNLTRQNFVHAVLERFPEEKAAVFREIDGLEAEAGPSAIIPTVVREMVLRAATDVESDFAARVLDLLEPMLTTEDISLKNDVYFGLMEMPEFHQDEPGRKALLTLSPKLSRVSRRYFEDVNLGT
jgi:hypothetical protein